MVHRRATRINAALDALHPVWVELLASDNATRPRLVAATLAAAQNSSVDSLDQQRRLALAALAEERRALVNQWTGFLAQNLTSTIIGGMIGDVLVTQLRRALPIPTP